MKFTKNKNQKGFTIIETLVAISILMLSITGPLVIVSQALKASYYSRDQITAFYLAQEAVEYIRNIRDETSLNTSNLDTQWLSGLTVFCVDQAKNVCVNAYDGPIPYKFALVRSGSNYTFEPCDSTGCSELTYDPDAATTASLPYGGQGTANSIFKRTIWLTTVPGDSNIASQTDVPSREVVVHVEVKWRQGTNENKFMLESHLSNWKLEKTSS